MWVVLRVKQLEVEQPGSDQFPYHITLDFSPMIGYLPVYATREEALSEYPDGPMAEVNEATKPSPPSGA